MYGIRVLQIFLFPSNIVTVCLLGNCKEILKLLLRFLDIARTILSSYSNLGVRVRFCFIFSTFTYFV
jgi:hypothetical protein